MSKWPQSVQMHEKAMITKSGKVILLTLYTNYFGILECVWGMENGFLCTESDAYKCLHLQITSQFISYPSDHRQWCDPLALQSVMPFLSRYPQGHTSPWIPKSHSQGWDIMDEYTTTMYHYILMVNFKHTLERVWRNEWAMFRSASIVIKIRRSRSKHRSFVWANLLQNKFKVTFILI